MSYNLDDVEQLQTALAMAVRMGVLDASDEFPGRRSDWNWHGRSAARICKALGIENYRPAHARALRYAYRAGVLSRDSRWID